MPYAHTTNLPAAQARSRRSLRRTVLSVAVAALVAAWLPFSAFYVSAINSRQPVVQTVTGKNGVRVITTRTSSGQTITTGSPSGAAATSPSALNAVSTRSS